MRGDNMITFWAFIYRLTGYMRPSVQLAFWEQVNWRDIQTALEKQDPDMDDDGFLFSLENILGMKEGMWQAKRGFTSVWNYGKPLHHKIYLYIKHVFDFRRFDDED
jgi:hypothetical protein